MHTDSVQMEVTRSCKLAWELQSHPRDKRGLRWYPNDNQYLGKPSLQEARSEDCREHSSRGKGRTSQKGKRRNAGLQVAAFCTQARTMETKSGSVGVVEGP